MRLQRTLSALTLCVVLIGSAYSALAGKTGGVSGRILDNDGAPIAGARVRIFSPIGSQTTRSGGDGFFAFVSVPPDFVTLSAEAAGHEPQSNWIRISSDVYSTLNLRLNRTTRIIGHGNPPHPWIDPAQPAGLTIFY